MTIWIYLSPHLDDAVYSCGGWIRDRVDAGDRVEIWTIFTADPPEGPLSAFAESLHARWELGRNAPAPRRVEDEAACALVGAGYRHWGHHDCIYRRDPATGEALYENDAELFGEPAQVELDGLVGELVQEWRAALPTEARVVCQLTVGGHADHRIVRRAAERLGRPLWYCADVPYVLSREAAVAGLVPEGVERIVYPVSQGGFRVWMAANAAYASQFSQFWGSGEEMEAQFREYLGRVGGVRLWKGAGGV